MAIHQHLHLATQYVQAVWYVFHVRSANPNQRKMQILQSQLKKSCRRGPTDPTRLPRHCSRGCWKYNCSGCRLVTSLRPRSSRPLISCRDSCRDVDTRTIFKRRLPADARTSSKCADPPESSARDGAISVPPNTTRNLTTTSSDLAIQTKSHP